MMLLEKSESSEEGHDEYEEVEGIEDEDSDYSQGPDPEELYQQAMRECPLDPEKRFHELWMSKLGSSSACASAASSTAATAPQHAGQLNFAASLETPSHRALKGRD